MPNKCDYVYCSCGGWEGLYIDNILYIQSHKITLEDWWKVAQKTNISFKEITEHELACEYFETIGELPEKFSDLSEEYLY